MPSSTSLSNSDCVSPALDDFLHSTTWKSFQQRPEQISTPEPRGLILCVDSIHRVLHECS